MKRHCFALIVDIVNSFIDFLLSIVYIYSKI